MTSPISKATFLKLLCALIFAAVFYFVFAPASIQDDVYAFDAPKTKAAVLKVVPIGTKINVATYKMESKGFRCFPVNHTKYAYNGVPAADNLLCDSGDKPAGFFVSKRWQVVFVNDNGLIASITVNVGLTGP